MILPLSEVEDPLLPRREKALESEKPWLESLLCSLLVAWFFLIALLKYNIILCHLCIHFVPTTQWFLVYSELCSHCYNQFWSVAIIPVSISTYSPFIYNSSALSNLSSAFYLHGFAYSRASYQWNPSIGGCFCLGSFT